MPDPQDQSVTAWLADLKHGDHSAAGRVWSRYFQRLVRLAQNHLRSAETRVEDEEDVALSVLDSLCAGAAAERFEKVSNREELWVLLATMTHRKCVNRIRRNVALKRGGGRLVGEADLEAYADLDLDQIEASAPTAETLAVLQEEYEQLMAGLRNDELRQIAQWRLDGFSGSEIAEKLGLSERSVRRKLELIRDTWTAQLEPPPKSDSP